MMSFSLGQGLLTLFLQPPAEGTLKALAYISSLQTEKAIKPVMPLDMLA